MKLLIALTYYRPYTSGLTIYVERLATALAARGHTVTVLTSQYDRTLQREEHSNGVRIVRVPVAARISKGVIMPLLGATAARLIKQHDAVNLHLPQFDTPGLALRGWLRGRPVVLTYHCDVKLAPSLFNRVANAAVNLADDIGARLATAIVTSTQDYADHSPYLSRYQSKVRIVPPPVDMAQAKASEVQAFAQKWRIEGPVIGMAARLAAEKGVEVLLDAWPRVLEAFPHARVLFAGPHENVFGEQAYATRLAPLIARHAKQWTFLGMLSQRDLPAFYANCSSIVVPSLNSTEAFGLVQVEAMLNGTPSIASDLPGVRQPVLQSGMGEVVPVGDSNALASAILRVLADKRKYIRPRTEIEARWSTRTTIAGYEALLTELIPTECRQENNSGNSALSG
jgi:glycosyltransferase involved in cell wall biosynthesis